MANITVSEGVDGLISRTVDTLRGKFVSLDPEGQTRVLARQESLSNSFQHLIGKLAEKNPSVDSFDLGDWESFHGRSFTEYERSIMDIFVWSHETLNSPCPFYKGKKICETHDMFVTIDGLSIMELQKIYPTEGVGARFYTHRELSPWTDEKFMTTSLRLGQYLLLKGMVPNSAWQPFEKQLGMLPPTYEVPPASVAITRDLLMFQKYGTLGMGWSYAVRTADKNFAGDRIYIEGTGPSHCEISIKSWPEDMIQPYVGIAAMRYAELPLRGGPIDWRGIS